MGEIRFFSCLFFYHLYAVMQVSMNEHVNHILASCILFFHRFFFREFRIFISDPLHSYNCKVLFFSFLFRRHRKYSPHFISLFTFSIFRRYVFTCRLQFTHEARRVTLFRYTLTISFSLFSISSILYRRRCIWAYLIRGLLCFSVHRK